MDQISFLITMKSYDNQTDRNEIQTAISTLTVFICKHIYMIRKCCFK